ncbi:MAG: ferredoxin family protein [Bdellovibrionales bacterium]|nr:ferredoxin family protein [Bdellovibrionales bacterium]
MTYIVTQHCVDCKYTDCVAVCPVDAFHEGGRILYINPDTCVNCDACVPACPVEAIFSEENLPSKFTPYIDMNREGCVSNPVINQKKDAMPSAKALDELKQMDGQGYVPANWP